MTKKAHESAKRSLLDAQAELENQARDREGRIAGLEQDLLGVEDEVKRLRQLEREAQTRVSDLDAQLATMTGLKEEAEQELAEALAAKSALRASVASMRAALSEASQRRAAAEKRLNDYRKLLERFKPLMDAGRLDVRIVDGRMVVALSMDILFESGKANLTDAGRAALLETGAILAELTDKHFQVEGHTDSVPIRTRKFPSNWELGSARALEVAAVLREGGVQPKQISAATFGEFKPAADNESEVGREKNRRIEIVVQPDLSDLPGHRELSELSPS